MNRRMKYWVMLAASVAVLVAVIVWPVKRPEEKKLPEKSEILGMMQEQSQIATTEVTIRKMAIYDSDTQIASLNPAKWKLGKRVCVVPVDVTIRYGIDLTELKESDLQFVGEDTLEIRLPKAKIIDKSFNPVTNQNEIVTLSTGLRDEVGEATIQKIKNMAFDEVVNHDLDFQKQLSAELTHNTEAVFTSLLEAVGLHPVFVH